MKRNEDFRNALGEPDEYFQQSVMDTLNQLNRRAERESRPKRSFSVRLVCSFATLALLIGGIVMTTRNDHHDYVTAAATNPVDITVAAQPTVTPEETLQVIETEQATMTVRKALTDGYGVFIAVEVVPKDKNTLVLYDGADPFSLPDEIGAEADYNGQNLYEWPAKHGYSKILRVSFSSPEQEESPTADAHMHSYWNKNRNRGLTAHGSETIEDGKAMVLVTGTALPDTNAYDLVWELVPCSASAFTANRADMEEALDYEKGEYGVFQVPVTSTGEEPRILARYATVGSAVNNPEDKITFTCLATSLAQYFEARTQGSKLTNVIQCIPKHYGSVMGYIQDAYLFSCTRQDDNTTLLREIRRFDNGFPETLALCLGLNTGEYTDEAVQRDYGADKAASVPVTLRFTEAEKNGSDIRITVEVSPAHDHCLVLTASHLLIESCEYVSDYYGIQSESPEQSLYDWVVDHGYREALAFEVWAPSDKKTDSAYTSSYLIEKCKIREDGSAVMTIVGPASGDNNYDLEYHVVPWNMDDRGDSFLPAQHETGLIHLTVSEGASPGLTVTVTPEKSETVELLEVSADGAALPIPPIDEYSRKAWGFSNEDYTNLLNDFEHRIGQVYMVKGTVQEILSDNPRKVLINVGEDGASLPVIIRSPDYYNFPWEAGAAYTIYADVSSLEENVPVLTARYTYTK